MLALGLVAVLGGCGADGAGNARDSSSAARVRPGQEPAPPPTPGTYKYRQTGTITMSGKTRSVPETGRFVLDRARGEPSGARTQVWHSYLDARENPSDVTLQFRPDAIALVQQTQRIINAGQTFVFTCKFKEPLAALPWPLVVGYRDSGKGGCGPLFKVSVTGTRQVDLDGAPHTAGLRAAFFGGNEVHRLGSSTLALLGFALAFGLLGALLFRPGARRESWA
jgi:hypothetical protein